MLPVDKSLSLRWHGSEPAGLPKERTKGKTLTGEKPAKGKRPAAPAAPAAKSESRGRRATAVKLTASSVGQVSATQLN